MKGKGHLWGALAFAPLPLTLFYPVHPASAALALVGCFFGARAPDYLELDFIPHRTITHTLSIWLCVALYGAYAYLPPDMRINELEATSKEIGALICGFGCGGVSHWLGDVLNIQRVPVFTPFDRFAFGLFRSGDHQAFSCLFIFLISLALTLAILLYGRPF